MAGAVGSIVGQLVTSKEANWRDAIEEINWKDVGVAFGVGAVAGAFLPFTATTYLGAAATGGVANLVQYTLSQFVNDRPSKYDPNTLFSPNPVRSVFQRLVNRDINEALIARINLLRSLASSIYSNFPWPDWLRRFTDTLSAPCDYFP